MSLTGDVLGQIGAEVSMTGGVGGSINFDGSGTDNYNELDNKPSINGVVLQGNKTTEDLLIETGGTDDYLDLNNKPKINNVTLTGNVSSDSLQIDYQGLINKPDIPDVTDIENRLTSVENSISSINIDIGDIEDDLTDIASDIATLKATDLVHTSDINSLKNRVTAAETGITNLGLRVTDAENSITYQAAQIRNLEDDTTDIITDMTALGNRVGTAEGNITSLNTIVGDGQQSVGTDLTDAVTQLNSNIIVLSPTTTSVIYSLTSSSSAQNFTVSEDGFYNFYASHSSGAQGEIKLANANGDTLWITQNKDNNFSCLISSPIFFLKAGTYKLTIQGSTCGYRRYTL